MSRRANRSAGPRRRKYTARALDPANMAGTLNEIMAIGDGEVPVKVTGWYLDRSMRRVQADYPNGWRLTFSVTPAGNITRICGSLHISTGPV